ncbi:MAG: MFS transporter [Anaerolineae bacterium]|nr:MFS transporter [Anaerolineae bacterium]
MHKHLLSARTVYLVASGGMSFFLTLIFTLNLVYHVKSVGLNALQLVLVGTVLELSTFLFEIPTGVIADRYSRRLSTIIGFFVLAAGFLIEGAFPTFGSLLLAQVVWGLGYTFISGAFDAWVTDEVGAEAVGEIFIRGGQVGTVLSLLAIPLSILLGNISLNLPILVGAGLLAVMGGWLAVVMPENHFTPTAGEEKGFTRLWEGFRDGLSSLHGNRAVLQFMGVMLFVGLASEAYDRMNSAHFLTNFHFPQPFTFTISDETWFGILGLVSAVLTLSIAEWVRKCLDLRWHQKVLGWLITVSMVTALAILWFALARSVLAAMAAFLLISVSRSVLPPIQNAWINQHIESRHRATTLSMSSQMNALGQIAGGPILGWVGKQVSIVVALAVSGILHFGPAVLFGASYRDSIDNGHTPVKEFDD